MSLPDREKAAELGRGLRRVRDSIQKQDPTGRTNRIWFQGAEPYLDAIFEVSGETLLWFQVTLRGRSLTWDAQRGCVVTGHTGELAVEEARAPASKTIEADESGDRAVAQTIHWMLSARAGEHPFDGATAVVATWLGER
ncbi:MAG TPA: hypothetical protein VGK67_24265 [Myxococcales bacterium]|jgi:hypothetical protein